MCPHGVEVFLDANVLYCHFTQLPSLSDPCSDFLQRIADQDLVGHTTSDALADAVHKVMLAEATVVHHLERAGLVRRLREHPELIKGLAAHQQVAPEVRRIGIRVHPQDAEGVAMAAAIGTQEGVLMGDALILAAMRHLGLLHLATNDEDFERIPGLVCYFPQ